MNKDKKYYELVYKLNHLEDEFDTEIAHGKADNYIVDFLKEIGFEELADAYESIEKWYS